MEPRAAPRVGDYALLSTLGTGTTGKVKLAEHQRTHQKAAIKIIKKSVLDEHAHLAVKIRREIALMRLFDNPHLLRLLEVCQSSQHLYIILEFAEHGELFDQIESHGSLSVEAGMNFFRQIIYGLEYLHMHGICHRDLKPENILLDAHDMIKIADFGFARWMRHSRADTSCGSPHYAAPEIVRGEQYDGRTSDIWSCGVILYTMLSGSLPFDDTSIRALLQKVRIGQYRMPTGFPPDIRALIARMLEVDPAKRITIPEIKQSDAFRRGMPPMYCFPTPLPLPIVRDSIRLEDLDAELRDVFRQLGYENDDELREDLGSQRHSIAKNFYRILKAEISWDNFEWDFDGANRADAPAGAGPIPLPQASFGWGSSFGEATMMASSDSLEGSVLHTRLICAAESPNSDGANQAIYFSVPLEWMMMAAQDFLSRRAFAWFHPDETTILARRKEPQMDVELRTEFDLSAQLRLKPKLKSGEQREFDQIVADLREWIEAIVAPE
jgi:BR serine/threonine kinase